MDTSVVSVIIAIIALVPGLWAWINQVSKDKEQSKLDMFKTIQHTVYEIIPPLQTEMYKLGIANRENREIIGSLIEQGISTTDEVWKRMYEKPVIVRCQHCKSPNVITSLNCIHCGAPIED